MEHIILDTNIFLKENFLEGKRIKELLKLSEKEKIKIVLTKITVEEVKNNYKKFVKKALKNLAVFRKPFESRVLRNNSIGKHLYDKIDGKQVEKEFNEEFDALLIKSKVIIIDYSELDIKPVFDKYFAQEYPFNGGDKKSEFPDAFALALIEKWCIDNNIKCIVFSSDKDFLNFESEHLQITKDYEVYLDDKLQFLLTQHRLTILQKLFTENSKAIDQKVEQWYRDKLDDYTLYYPIIWNEIHDIEITEIVITKKSYQIVAIEHEAIEIEVEVELTFKVEIIIDDEDYSYYDSDDRTRHYLETKVEEIEQRETAKLSVLAYITDEDDYDEDLDVVEINKDVELVIENNDDYYNF